MKLLKTLTVGLLAAATAGSASAAVTIVHVAGSTAFRTGTSIAIIDTLAGTTALNGVPQTPTQVYGAYSDTSLAGAKQQIFANGYIGSVDPSPGNDVAATIIVEATWTGSLAGVVDLVTASSSAAFIDETNATVIASVNGDAINGTTYLPASSTAGALNSTSLTKLNGTVELAQSDSYKQTISKELATGTLSGTLGSFNSIGALATAVGGSTVTQAGTGGFAGGQDAVAVVPFEWVTGINSGTGYTAPTNITQESARQLITAGFVAQGLLTGTDNAGDKANYFYLEGRNEDSGTRIGAFSEAQFGVTLAPTQYQVGDDNTTVGNSANPTQLFPITALNTEGQISWGAVGHSGYSSGSNVSAALKIANSGSVTFLAGANGGKAKNNSGGSYFIGYLGLTDAASAIGAGATALQYNGVTGQIAFNSATPTVNLATNIENGSYSFWAYEHSYRLSSLSGNALTVVNNIADNLYFNDADVIYSTSTGASHGDPNFDGNYTNPGFAGLFLFDMVSSRGFEGSAISHN